jgi:hypothetical protein
MASGFIGTNFGSSRNTNVDLSRIEDLDTTIRRASTSADKSRTSREA